MDTPGVVNVIHPVREQFNTPSSHAQLSAQLIMDAHDAPGTGEVLQPTIPTTMGGHCRPLDTHSFG